MRDTAGQASAEFQRKLADICERYNIGVQEIGVTGAKFVLRAERGLTETPMNAIVTVETTPGRLLEAIERLARGFQDA